MAFPYTAPADARNEAPPGRRAVRFAGDRVGSGGGAPPRGAARSKSGSSSASGMFGEPSIYGSASYDRVPAPVPNQFAGVGASEDDASYAHFSAYDGKRRRGKPSAGRRHFDDEGVGHGPRHDDRASARGGSALMMAGSAIGAGPLPAPGASLGKKPTDLTYSSRDKDMKSLIFGEPPEARDLGPQPTRQGDDFFVKEVHRRMAEERSGIAAKVGGYVAPESDGAFEERTNMAVRNALRGHGGQRLNAIGADEDAVEMAMTGRASPRKKGKGLGVLRPQATTDVVSHDAARDGSSDADLVTVSAKPGAFPIDRATFAQQEKVAEERRKRTKEARAGHRLWETEFDLTGTKDKDVMMVVDKVGAKAPALSEADHKRRGDMIDTLKQRNRGQPLWVAEYVSGEKDKDYSTVADKVTTARPVAADAAEVRSRYESARKQQERNRGERLW